MTDKRRVNKIIIGITIFLIIIFVFQILYSNIDKVQIYILESTDLKSYNFSNTYICDNIDSLEENEWFRYIVNQDNDPYIDVNGEFGIYDYTVNTDIKFNDKLVVNKDDYINELGNNYFEYEEEYMDYGKKRTFNTVLYHDKEQCLLIKASFYKDDIKFYDVVRGDIYCVSFLRYNNFNKVDV